MITTRELYQRLYVYIRPHWWRVALSMVASLGIAATDGAMVKLVQPFVDRLIVAGEREMLILAPFLIIGLQLAKGISRFAQEYYIKSAGQLAIQRIRNHLFEHIMGLSMRFYGRTPNGVLMSKVMNDVGTMQSATAEVLVGVMRDAVSLVVLIGVAFYTDWKMAAIAFLSLPIAAFPAAKIGKKIKRHARSGQAAIGDLNSVLEQTFSGIKVIKAFGTEGQETRRFSFENNRFLSSVRKVIKYDAMAAPFIEVLTGFGAAAVVWYGMQRVIAGEMSQGQLFSVLAAIMLMYAPFKRLTKLNNYMQLAISAAERVFDVFDEKPEIVDAAETVSLGRARGAVTFASVSFAYDRDPVLTDFSLEVQPGEVIAFVGPSGAGKTTLVGLLSRFYDPTSGRILLDGHDLRQISLASLRRNVALVDQETFLFNDTIANNLRYGVPEATEDQVREAARLAYADDFIQQFPEGYATDVGQRGLRISGGQRQRLCIARALLRDAPVLILDEATSALDTESEAMVQKALANLMQNRTTFVIAHRLSTIMNADRIIVLDGGRVVGCGTHQQLLREDGLYRRLYDMQFQDS
ncbi:MAG: lipid A export permease/ATP-binding protein MsbA [Desulfuromonadales bacterium GWD2_61_12]|nr:MAG: lipid A export permease/ATP-binding protein MsbA [Desulfuromonadales bacterium GWC2_61_20]OGR35400.1 MAG: lipid A export permease/ATP-binding protein MsbA [Desulfuromonadales bacterium GWD2_61_12]HAD03658.1 lipid A export permease/ATP-binding protein MsbA [Desulfuromonas sp.]HBT83901.1 lipid A export permease/ATP-binding protein MsbA [Desulfuromonas sp.]